MNKERVEQLGLQVRRFSEYVLEEDVYRARLLQLGIEMGIAKTEDDLLDPVYDNVSKIIADEICYYAVFKLCQNAGIIRKNLQFKNIKVLVDYSYTVFCCDLVEYLELNIVKGLGGEGLNPLMGIVFESESLSSKFGNDLRG